MGGSSSKGEALTNAAIELQNKKDHAVRTREIKMLLLGAGESGKSTLFKQVRQLYGKKYSKDELRSFMEVVHRNVFYNMTLLLEHSLENGDYGAEQQEVEDFLATYHRDSLLTPEAAEKVVKLFNHPVSQHSWVNRHEFQILESLKYFIDEIDRISASNYIPTQKDHLFGRVRSTGIAEEPFIVKGVKFKLLDVGGQRNERRKWLFHFSDVTAVMYLIAISEFDQTLFEDGRVKRVKESRDLFKQTLNQPAFADTPFIVFFNKVDILNQKLKTKRLSDHFKDYEGPDFDSDGITQEEVEMAGREFMKRKFLKVNQNEHLVYSYFTTATDSQNVDKVFDSTRDIILRNALSGHIFTG